MAPLRKHPPSTRVRAAPCRSSGRKTRGSRRRGRRVEKELACIRAAAAQIRTLGDVTRYKGESQARATF
eukprot:7372470-Pyramimonas_sp.AAC.1